MGSHSVRQILAPIAVLAAGLALMSCAALGVTTTQLDAAQADQNAGNVRLLADENEKLHVQLQSPPATLEAARKFNASAIRLADSMVEATR